MQESVVHKKERPLILETWRKHPVSKTSSFLSFNIFIRHDSFIKEREKQREREREREGGGEFYYAKKGIDRN